jgi:hypothetical protein
MRGICLQRSGNHVDLGSWLDRYERSSPPRNPREWFHPWGDSAADRATAEDWPVWREADRFASWIRHARGSLAFAEASLLGLGARTPSFTTLLVALVGAGPCCTRRRSADCSPIALGHYSRKWSMRVDTPVKGKTLCAEPVPPGGSHSPLRTLCLDLGSHHVTQAALPGGKRGLGKRGPHLKPTPETYVFW